MAPNRAKCLMRRGDITVALAKFQNVREHLIGELIL